MTRAFLAVALMLAITAAIGARIRYLDRRAKRLRAEAPDPAEMFRLHRDEMRREMDWNHPLTGDAEGARWLAAMDRKLFGAVRRPGC